MIQFNSLNNIIDDILLEARGSNLAESESLSRIQIEQWIIQYRSMLLKQDIDKGRDINEAYVQEIDNISISDKDGDDNYISNSDMWIGVSNIEIPATIDFHFEDSIVSITDQYYNPIQLMSEKRAKMQKSRRYTNRTAVAFGKNGYIYIVGQGDVDTIIVRGIFENPLHPVFGLTADDIYPIPANMIPTLKELIIKKEIMIYPPTDITNDGSNDINKVQNAKTS